MSAQQKEVSGLTFRRAAYGVVPEASPPLFEVGTGRASVPGGDGHLATPLRAADSARGRARRPGAPGARHAVNGCRYLAHAPVVLAAVPGLLAVGVAVARRLPLAVLEAVVVAAGAAVGALALPAARLGPREAEQRDTSANDEPTETRRAPSTRSHDGKTCPQGGSTTCSRAHTKTHTHSHTLTHRR